MLGWLFLLLLIPVTTLLVIRFVHIQVTLKYRVEGMDTHRITIKLRLLRFKIWEKTMQLPTLKAFLEENTTTSREVAWKELLPFLKKLKIKQLDWETGIGIGEAHLTGSIAGVVWTGKELGIGYLENKVKMLTSPTYTVKPNYYGEGFYSRFDCTFLIPIPTILKLRTLNKNQLKIKER